MRKLNVMLTPLIGDGHDTINVVKNSVFNHQSRNTSLIFGSGINPNSLTFTETNRTYNGYSPFGGGWGTYTVTDTIIGYGTQGDKIVAEGGLDKSAYFKFADGSSYDYDKLRHLNWWTSPGGTGGGEAANDETTQAWRIAA